MSAFIVLIRDTHFYIAADTLITEKTATGYTPKNYASKIYPLVSKNSVIVGVGALPILHKWYELAKTNILARDINTLNEYSTALMQDKLLGIYNNAYCCIYQIGFDETGHIHVYKYDSEEQYKSQEIIGTFICRPGSTNINLSSYNLSNPRESLYQIMCILRKEDAEETCDGSSSIGGHMEFLHMKNRQYSFEQYKAFDGFEADYFHLCN